MYKKLSLRFDKKLIFEKKRIGLKWEEIGKYIEFDRQALAFIEEFRETYKPFLKQNRYSELGYIYEFDSRRMNFEDVFEILLPYEDKINFRMYINDFYEDSDYEKAEVFLLDFEKQCYYYEDYNTDKYTSNVYIELDHWLLENHDYSKTMYMSPGNGVKKSLTNKFAGATSPINLNIISPMLKAYLAENGIEDEYMKPVCQKNGSIWAYYLDGHKNVIPSLTLLSDIDDRLLQLSGYNILTFTGIERGESLWNEFKESSNYGFHPRTTFYEIDRRALRNIEPVNLTEDYFNRNQLCVINRDVYDLLKAKVPKMILPTYPVFTADFDVTVGPGKCKETDVERVVDGKIIKYKGWENIFDVDDGIIEKHYF